MSLVRKLEVPLVHYHQQFRSWLPWVPWGYRTLTAEKCALGTISVAHSWTAGAQGTADPCPAVLPRYSRVTRMAWSSPPDATTTREGPASPRSPTHTTPEKRFYMGRIAFRGSTWAELPIAVLHGQDCLSRFYMGRIAYCGPYMGRNAYHGSTRAKLPITVLHGQNCLLGFYMGRIAYHGSTRAGLPITVLHEQKCLSAKCKAMT